jgi:thioredoxin reductase (NADPH)
MAKPSILLLDDEPHVLNAVERDLRRHYRDDYRIITASSGAQALEMVRQPKQRNTPVALSFINI